MNQQTRAAIIAGLSDQASTITSAASLEELAQRAVDEVRRVVEADYIAFYLSDPETSSLRMFAQHGFTDEEREEAERTALERHPGAVVRSRQRLHVPDVQVDSSTSTDRLRRKPVRSRLFLPLESEGQCIGAVGLASTEPDRFSPSHIETLDFLSRTIGVMHRNLWRLSALERRLAQLTEQQRQLNELSAPVSEIERGILVVPVIGRVDQARAEAITQNLLEATTARRARVVLLDLAGLSADDASAIPFLERAIQALALLGASCLLAGISPAIAQGAAAHGIALPRGSSHASLSQALRQARAMLDRA